MTYRDTDVTSDTDFAGVYIFVSTTDTGVRFNQIKQCTAILGVGDTTEPHL